MRRANALYVVVCNVAALIFDSRTCGALARPVNSDRIGVKAVILAKTVKVLVGDSAPPADVQNHAVRSRTKRLIERLPVNPAYEDRTDPVKHEWMTQDPLVE